MFNVGGGEMLFIFIIALVILGPEKLPNAARQMGKYMADFKRISGGFQQELRDAMELSPEASARATTDTTDADTSAETPDTPADPVPATALESSSGHTDAIGQGTNGNGADADPASADEVVAPSAAAVPTQADVAAAVEAPLREHVAGRYEPTGPRNGTSRPSIHVEGPAGSFT